MSHGHRKGGRSSLTYMSWLCMTQRCFNKNTKSYELYGGRGISVYFGWIGRGGFEEFLRDVGERPSKKMTLDRIDGDGHYQPGNVRWASKSVQNSNKSGYTYELDGERFTLYEKAGQLKLHPGALRNRIVRALRRGLSLEDARRHAFTTVKGMRRKRT